MKKDHGNEFKGSKNGVRGGGAGMGHPGMDEN